MRNVIRDLDQLDICLICASLGSLPKPKHDLYLLTAMSRFRCTPFSPHNHLFSVFYCYNISNFLMQGPHDNRSFLISCWTKSHKHFVSNTLMVVNVSNTCFKFKTYFSKIFTLEDIFNNLTVQRYNSPTLAKLSLPWIIMQC